MSEQSNTYLIGGAGLPVEQTEYPFNHSYEPRGFQREGLNWIYGDDRPPVAVLAAPTGAGKTDVITALGQSAEQLLCIYPTNALIKAQSEALRAAGLEVTTVTGDTLTGTGDDRAQNLLNIAQRGQRGGHDVFVTNPDVLQAVFQNLYFSPGSRLLNLYAQFDAVVFDEFHYYDSLGASGLLTQIKLLSERGTMLTKDGLEKPDVLLSSATPAPTFIDFVRDELDFDLTTIRSRVDPLDVAEPAGTPRPAAGSVYRDGAQATETARSITEQAMNADDLEGLFEAGVTETPSDSASRFRYPMLVHRHGDRLDESFDVIADRLTTTVERAYSGGAPIGAVIFNSAARSNEFQTYVERHHSDLASDVLKDNGYDTNAARKPPEDAAILNTTSKGEVGLNFDIKRLVMAKPFTATQFVQRIGRAGRQSPAVVDIYGLADPGWPSVQAYPQFLRRVTDTLDDTEHRLNQLRHLTGMRAAYALHDRLEGDSMYHTDAIFDDFRGYPKSKLWVQFFEALDASLDILADDSWTGPQLDRPTSNILRGTRAVRNGLQSLRGRTIVHSVAYPRGDRREKTEYDITSALAHYAIERIGQDNMLYLDDAQSPGPLRGYYPGEPNGGDGVDLMESRSSIDMTLQNGYGSLLSQATDLSKVPVERDVLETFFRMMPLYSSVLPERLIAGQYEITCNTNYGEVGDIAFRN